MKFLSIFFTILLPTSSFGQIFESVLVDKIISVYDGDTFRANIESWPDIIGKNISIRLNGTDTPEIKGKCAKERKIALEAKKFVEKEFTKANKIYLKNIKRGKYFRVVADVFLDGKSLKKLLEERNLSIPYWGGKKKNIWCIKK
tara:strand:+ start:51 stop:482 length:432 start_codon:yes stop_codon:yes gene_type:complete